MPFRKCDRLIRLKPKKRRNREKPNIGKEMKDKMREIQNRLNQMKKSTPDNHHLNSRSISYQEKKRKPVYLSASSMVATTPFAILQKRFPDEFRILGVFETVAQAKKFLKAIHWQQTQFQWSKESQDLPRFDIMHRSNRIDSIVSNTFDIPPGCILQQQKFAIINKDIQVLTVCKEYEEAQDIIFDVDDSLAIVPLNNWLNSTCVKAAFTAQLAQRADHSKYAHDIFLTKQRLLLLTAATEDAATNKIFSLPNTQQGALHSDESHFHTTDSPQMRGRNPLPHHHQKKEDRRRCNLLSHTYKRLEHLHQTADSRYHQLQVLSRLPDIHRFSPPVPVSPPHPPPSQMMKKNQQQQQHYSL